MGAGDPRGRRLLELADECGRLTGELTEVDEALRAADAAVSPQALCRLRALGHAVVS